MAANTKPSIQLTSLDFDTHKNSLKAFLKSQDRFKDWDFDGSNMSVLIDMLSLNTFQNAFLLNMSGSEMFMDSAQLRDSVVSHAKDLNYVPQSFRSSEALVNLYVTTSDLAKRTIVVPKGTTFTSRFGAKNYTFTTGENIILSNIKSNANNTSTFYGTDLSLFEGYYVADTFTVNYASPSRYLISNKNVDISSISLIVSEDNGASTLTYNRAPSLFDLSSSSQVFFIQGAENDSYEIVFGDGVSGRKPKDNSVIIAEYRVCNGQLPNGANSFVPDTTIDDESDIRVEVVNPASSGAVSESIESIKYNAPRHFTTQERAVTTEDYENLLKLNFPEINAVTAFGGEDLDPPQFGRVFVAVDLNDVDGLPEIKRDEYYRFLRPRSPVSIDPIFVNPAYSYIGIKTVVKYNVDLTNLTPNDIKTIVLNSILEYAQKSLNNFNRVFRYSALLQSIDAAQTSIISNETEVNVIKVYLPTDTGIAETFDIDFNLALDTSKSNAAGGYTINSSIFTYKGQSARLSDNAGQITVISSMNGAIIDTVGVIDYDTGLMQFSSFTVDSYVGNGIKIYAVPRSRDISTINNVILNILEEDVSIEVEATRE